MKKMILISIFVCVSLAVQAQGTLADHAEWVKFYSSYGCPSGSIFSNDKMEYTETDGQGNVYYCGKFSALCKQGTNGQEGMLVPELPDEVDSNANYCLWLAKYDTLGNELWHHSVCSSKGVSPTWMELREGHLYLTGMCWMPTAEQRDWLWFFDTLIRMRDFLGTPTDETVPPVDCNFNFVAKFDLSGNLQKMVFLKIKGRGIPQSRALLDAVAPMHIDIEGNMYFFSALTWYGPENMPTTIVTYNGDSVWNEDIYLPYTLPNMNHTCMRPIMYKFDAEGHLLWYKLMGMEADGIPLTSRHYQVIDGEEDTNAVYPYYRFHYSGFDADKEDNMYLTGNFTLLPPCTLNEDQYRALGYQYPARIYFDSTHWVHIDHRREALHASYLAKFDTSGNVLWIQQPHYRNNSIRNNPHTYIDATAYYGGITVTENRVFVLGGAFAEHDEDSIFFDDRHYFEREGDNAQHDMYPLFLCFEKESGSFVNYGTNYMRGTLSNGSAANGLYCDYDFKRHFALDDCVYATTRHKLYHSYTSGYSLWRPFLTVWQPHSRIADTIARIRCMNVEYANLHPLQNGRVLFDYSIRDDITIDSITFDAVNAGAVAFGLLHGKASQRIEWGQNLRYTLADSPITLTANATSGLPVSYEIGDNTVARIDNSTLHLLGVGETEVTASQGGDGNYLAATPVTRTLIVYDGTEGIRLTEKVGAVVVYPNPFQERITIRHDGPSTIVRAWLTDMAGRQEEVKLTAAGPSLYTLDFANHHCATYLLTLTTADGRQQTLRLLRLGSKN